MIGPVLYLCCTLSLSNYANVCFIESSSSRSGLFSWACAPLDWFFHLGILKKLYHLINFLFPLRQCLGCTVHGRMLVYDILHGIDTYHCYYRMRYWWPRHWYPGLNRMCRLTAWDRFQSDRKEIKALFPTNGTPASSCTSNSTKSSAASTSPLSLSSSANKWSCLTLLVYFLVV